MNSPKRCEKLTQEVRTIVANENLSTVRLLAEERKFLKIQVQAYGSMVKAKHELQTVFRKVDKICGRLALLELEDIE